MRHADRLQKWGLICSWLLLLFVFSQCRMATVGKEVPSEDTGRPGGDVTKTPVAPVSTPSPDSFSKTFGVMFDQSGQLVGTLILKLDYLPDSKPGGIAQVSCHEAVAGHLVIGRVRCDSQDSLVQDVQVLNANQVCYSATPTPRVTASKQLAIPGCLGGGATIQVYKADPAWKLEYIP